jgi:5-methylcytosine-specific restriction endonuclease McrA
MTIAGDLNTLAGWAPRLESADFDIGQWAPQHASPDGVIQMPWFQYSDEASAFLRDLSSGGWVQDIDWMEWAGTPAGQRLQTDISAIDEAGSEDLVRLLTTIVRGDRFNEGEIAVAFERGILQRVARRAEVLAIPDLPFTNYEGGGRIRLKRPPQGNGTARSGYGPPVFKQCGYTCVYCGLDMRASFANWLQLSVDHVIPRQMTSSDFKSELVEDITNLVTCCRACNDFGNRYRVDASAPATDADFYDLRDRVFRRRKLAILKKRAAEEVTFSRMTDVGPDLPPPVGESA